MLRTELHAFHAVARCGSFTKAAKSINVSQPVLSRQVGALKSRFKVQLFDRSTRTVALTNYGTALLDITNRLFAIEGEALEFLRNAGQLRAGRISVGTVDVPLILPILSVFGKSYPDIFIETFQSSSLALLDRLLNYSVDMAFLSIHRPQQGLTQVLVGTYSTAVFVPAGHKWASRKSIDLRDLKDAKLIVPERESIIRKQFEAQMAARDIPFRRSMVISGAQATVQAVHQSLGVALGWDAIKPATKSVISVPIADGDLKIPIYLSYLSDRQNWLSIKALAQCAIDTSLGTS